MTLRREASLAAVLAAIFALLAVRAPGFFEPDHFRSVLVRIAPTLVAAIGMTLAIVARQIDISIGAQASLCGVAAGWVAASGLPMPLAFAAAVLVGAVFGAANGWLIAALGLPSIVVTLATMAIGREGLRWAREGEFIRNLPDGFQWFGMGIAGGSLAVGVVTALIYLAASWALQRLPAARAIYAVGSDAETARILGLRPDRVVFGVFVAMGSLVGVAALLDAVRFADVDPNAGMGFELRVIAAVVVGGTAVSGGRGNLLGTLLGVLLLGIIAPALVFLGFEPQWEKAIQGIIILTAIAADAQGRRSAT